MNINTNATTRLPYYYILILLQIVGILRFRGVEGTAIATATTSGINDYPEWAFLVIADSHTFTDYSWTSLEQSKQSKHWSKLSTLLSHIKDDYGGELVLLPGDMVSYGRFLTSEIQRRISNNAEDNNLTPQEAVYIASMSSSHATRVLFQEVGYDTVLASVGDHDIGGNEGFKMVRNHMSKIDTIPDYRRGFGDGYNKNEKNILLFDEMLGDDIPSRPVGTSYENTSFAHVHKNTLFITLDAFEIVGDGSANYLDRKRGLGGEGAVTCTVTGDHLRWFERILNYGKESSDIRHMIVQAHLPIIQPVQKVDTSGQFFDLAEESDLWQKMNEYGVDIYFAGDVHANTATKSRDSGSNLVQIVTRGVSFNNFLKVNISDDIIDVSIYNEFGEKRKFNGQYSQSGRLTIDKSSEVTRVSSTGALELLDLDYEILMYDFEDIFPLGTRQVLSMSDKKNMMVTERMIRDELCKESIFNHGGFGAQYDAQVCNINLIKSRIEGEYAGWFSNNSRFGIYGIGPFSGGEIVSFGLWIKTRFVDKKMVLLHHANHWGTDVLDIDIKDHFILALELGMPVIHIQPTIKLEPLEKLDLADKTWHHIAVSMPKKSCKVSQIKIFIDGLKVETSSVPNDRPIFQTTTGRMSLGGFGYSNRGFEDAYPDFVPYQGALDDFKLYARPLKMWTDFPSLFSRASNPSEIQIPYPSTSNLQSPSQSPSQSKWKSSSSSQGSNWPSKLTFSDLPSQSPRKISPLPSDSPSQTSSPSQGSIISNNFLSAQPTPTKTRTPLSNHLDSSSITSSATAKPKVVAKFALCTALLIATFYM